jgi:hypothetical protein
MSNLFEAATLIFVIWAPFFLFSVYKDYRPNLVRDDLMNAMIIEMIGGLVLRYIVCLIIANPFVNGYKIHITPEEYEQYRQEEQLYDRR